MRLRLPPATPVAVAAVFALVGNLATNTVEVDRHWAWVVWSAACTLIVVSILVDIRIRRAGQPEPSATGLNITADNLAVAVRRQWQREEDHRRVADPIALPVHWQVADPKVIDHWPNVCRTPPGSTAAPLSLSGRLHQIAEIYQRIPSGRLVILGRGGAGKTVLAARLALDLLSARTAESRVPVIVSIGSWNPETASLQDWLVTQLVRDYPALARRVDGTDQAAALLAEDRILPVLDGFDEINPGLHPAALRQLNTVASMPLILTSRPQEYTEAVRDVDVLTNAAAITLDDLSIDDLTDYLPRTTARRSSAGAGVWTPVLQRLRDDSAGSATAVLSQVLSTPLMVYLARTVYSDTPGRDPTELLDPVRFGTREALEEFLVAAYLPAIYQQPASRGVRHRKVSDASAWLTYLARHLDRLGTRDLAWWQLRDTVARWRRVLFSVLSSVLVTELVLWFVSEFAMDAGLDPSFTVAVIVMPAVVLVVSTVTSVARTGPEPVRTRFRMRGRGREAGRRFGAGVDIGIIGGSLIIFTTYFAVYVSLLPAVALLLLIAVGGGLLPSAASAGRLRVRVCIWARRGLRCVVLIYIVVGISAEIQDGYYSFDILAAYLGPPICAGLLFGLTAVVIAPVDLTTTVDANESRTADRNHTLLQSIAVAVLGGSVGGAAFGVVTAAPTGYVTAAVVGVLGGFLAISTRAWGQWLILVRFWLPVTGRLPWAMNDFLLDAYRRGVLRQAGGVYQFRHARLQDHLVQISATARPEARRPAAPDAHTRPRAHPRTSRTR